MLMSSKLCAARLAIASCGRVLTLEVTEDGVDDQLGSTTGCTITEKAPTRAFSWLKALVGAFNQEKALVQPVVEPS